MRATFLLLVICVVLPLISFRSNKPAYVIYNQAGKEIKYKQMIDMVSDADIILFGELHNNPIAHWLELSIEKELFTDGKSLVLGSEMFQSDEQLILDEYLSGRIQASNFEKEACLWDNYQTDYKPLIEFAKENKIPWIATNIPRRYAAIVSQHGFDGLDSLSSEAKQYITPLPAAYDPELPGYKSMRDMMSEHARLGGISNPDYFSKAQAIKDATMAWFIIKNFKKGECFLHFNGSYHSNNFEGLSWYLKKYNPDLKIVTINSVEEDDPERLKDENINTANIIIAIPSDMTKTY